MAITDISISEELQTNAPPIKYRGNEGPKSPQEMEMMMQTSVDDPFYRGGEEDDHSMRMFGKPYKELNADELEEFREEMMRLMNKFSGGENNRVRELLLKEETEGLSEDEKEELRQLIKTISAQGPVLPSDEDPINPFGPKPEGPVLPDRQMAAYGGIMGMDGRKQYGIGSFFQKAKDKFIDDIIPNEIKENPLAAAAAAAYGIDTFGIPGTSIGGNKVTNTFLNDLFSKSKKRIVGADQDEVIEEKPGLLKRASDFVLDLSPNTLATVGGGLAGLFTKNQPDQPTGMPSDDTAMNIRDLAKTANVLDQKQGMAAGLNFLPSVAARKYSPAEMANTYAQAANGGRIGYSNGGSVMTLMDGTKVQIPDGAYKDGSFADIIYQSDKGSLLREEILKGLSFAQGGRIGKAEGGIMDLGGMEKDYRAEGGFVPIGREEKADDVPARLSVNEFVFTADAVRNAGGGDIDQGAKVMENMMKHLEAGGQVSEESQGMAGARDMFEVSERLSEVV